MHDWEDEFEDFEDSIERICRRTLNHKRSYADSLNLNYNEEQPQRIEEERDLTQKVKKKIKPSIRGDRIGTPRKIATTIIACASGYGLMYKGYDVKNDGRNQFKNGLILTGALLVGYSLIVAGKSFYKTYRDGQ